MSSNDTLKGRRPSETYPGLLKLGRAATDKSIIDAKLDGNVRPLQDGEGNDTPVSLSSSGVSFYNVSLKKPPEEKTDPDGSRRIRYYLTYDPNQTTATKNEFIWAEVLDYPSEEITYLSAKLSVNTEFKKGVNVVISDRLQTFTTDSLTEGATNKYFSVSAARKSVSSGSPKLDYNSATGVFKLLPFNSSDITEDSNLFWTQKRFDDAFDNKTTTNLKEGSNLYFTQARARASISVSGGGTYNSSTGVISIPTTAAASSALSGGATQQIPYQLTSTTTGFSSKFKWNYTNTMLVLGDATTNASITGVGGSTKKTELVVASGSSDFGSDLTLVAGSATATKGGIVTILGGDSTTGVGGDVLIAAGNGATDGSIVLKTNNVEQLRLTAMGALSTGSTGNATGTTNQYLASNGSSAPPSWKSLPTRVNESAYADNLKGGPVGAIPFQSALNTTGFSDVSWDGSKLTVGGSSTISGKGSLTITTADNTSGNIIIATGTPNATVSGDVILLTGTGATGGNVSLSTPSYDSLTVNRDGSILLGGVKGTTNQVPMVDSAGKTKYVTMSTNQITEGSKLFWTQARFDASWANKTTDNLTEGTTNKYWSNQLFNLAFATKNTSDLSEGGNLYWTQARFNSAFTAKSTSDLKEGTRLYWTQARFDAALVAKTTTDVAEGSNLYWTQVRFNNSFSAKTTTELAEGSNLYFTPTRARDSISVTGGILTYAPGTGILGTDISTSKVPEGTNKYYTDSRARAAISVTGTSLQYDAVTGKLSTNISTSKVAEDASNLYFTTDRARSSISVDGNILAYDAPNGIISTNIDTSKVAEKTNLYFTTARARSVISVADGLTYNATSGVIGTALTTDKVAETAANMYFTPERARTSLVVSGNILVYNNSTGELTTTIDTSKVAEKTNLYFTNARARSAISTSGDILTYTASTGVLSASIDTSKVAENTNLYFTQSRARSSISVTGGILGYDTNTGVISTNIDTSKVAEKTNLYFTQTRARTSISVSGDLEYNQTTGVISYSMPTGSAGYVPFVDANTSKYKAEPLINVGSFVSSDAALEFAKNQVVPQSQIIGKWTAFSHAGSTQPANPGELSAWEYVSAENAIRNTTNSVTFIGLVSDTEYEDYDHEVLVKSTNADDDTIGLVAAFTVIDGKEYTITATRTCGGNGRPWVITYNRNQTTSKDLTGVNNAVKWSNGGYGATATEAGYTGSPGWAAFTAGTKIKITRRGNIITFITTDLNSDVYIEASKITIDLSADPVLQKFIGKTRIGFCSLSQQFSYWQQLSFVDYSPIYDLRTGTKWAPNASGVWTQDTTSNIYSQIGVGRLIMDRLSGAQYYINSYGKYVKVGSTTSETATSVSRAQFLFMQDEITLAANATQTFDATAIIGASNITTYDLTSVTVELLTLDTVSSSPTYQFYVPATAVSVIGVKKTGQFVVVNPTTTSRTYMVRAYIRRV